MSGVFVYHAKRQGFVGERLYPLNALRDKLPEVYNNAVKKYQGREWLLDVVIPPLNALWNDVIHLSLMHPAVIYRALSDTGFSHHICSVEWIAVPIEDVVRLPSTLYRNIRIWQDTKVLLPDDFEAAVPERVTALSGMPDINLAYYRECFGRGEKPLLWKRAPHVLVKGELDISRYKTFDWKE